MQSRMEFSGVYPHLAVFNQSSGECGIGAVVPWAARLWYITYCPHQPGGSPDKLYELDTSLNVSIRPESIGGTPASRMIHRESNQLIIGPYFIDAAGKVRAISSEAMPGRLTGVCRHLTSPAEMVYIYDMEGAFYEVNVYTLAVTRLFGKAVPGWHGKGLYQGQGRIVLSNNGEWHVGGTDTSQFQVTDLPASPNRLGCLAEWDGKTWRIVERRQHTEVSGPGGLSGNAGEDDPIWAMGWDRRSTLLKVLDHGVWHRFRLPKANYTYDGDHGWHTEWPRIRKVADGFLMMDLHGMFYRFPESFRAGAAKGIRPLSSHHQMVVDFCEWQGRTVMACNHASHFNNPLLGRCQSNLWFIDQGGLDAYGPRSGWGGPWIDDDVAADEVSEPFLFAGFDQRILHLSHRSGHAVEFVVELDAAGLGNWSEYQRLGVPAGGSLAHIFPGELAGEWIRLVSKHAATAVTAYFHYNEDPSLRIALRAAKPDVFAAIPSVDRNPAVIGGIIRPMGKGYPQEETRLQYIAKLAGADGHIEEVQYVVDQDMAIRAATDPAAWTQFKVDLAGDVAEPDFGADAASVWIEEDGQRYRLPRGSAVFDQPLSTGVPRGKREIITERCVWNIHGSFYEIPRKNSFGVRHLRPICTHNRTIMDFCTWRGLLTIVGIAADAMPDAHCVRSEDARVGLWFGAVDDLWKLGKPVGTGGPWQDTLVQADTTSDPYLMTGYDRKTMILSHDGEQPVTFRIELDATGYGDWTTWREFPVEPGGSLHHEFPVGFSAHWVRLSASVACRATARFVYE